MCWSRAEALFCSPGVFFSLPPAPPRLPPRLPCRGDLDLEECAPSPVSVGEKRELLMVSPDSQGLQKEFQEQQELCCQTRSPVDPDLFNNSKRPLLSSRFPPHEFQMDQW